MKIKMDNINATFGPWINLAKTPEERTLVETSLKKVLDGTKSAKFTNIVTKDTNEKTGANTCTATVEMPADDAFIQLVAKADFGFLVTKNIAYLVEKSDEGKSFVVSTQGL